MQSANCKTENCTIGTTGVCLETGESTPCEHASFDIEDDIAGQLAGIDDRSTNQQNQFSLGRSHPKNDDIIHPGVELGLDDMSEIMIDVHSHIFAILGAYNTGKTLFLASLYLKCACGDLEDHGYKFAGSLTLPGFEDRARATRRWIKGAIPNEMSVHTSLTDIRSAGFMHLDLWNCAARQRRRLLLSDLPGEWSSDLVNSARYAIRLPFLPRADTIFIMIDGPSLANHETRHQEIDQQKILMDRIAGITAPNGRRLGLIATKGDIIGLGLPEGLVQLVDHADDLGFSAKGMVIASLSGNKDVSSGSGVFEAIAWALAPTNLSRTTSLTSTVAAGRPARLFGHPIIASGRFTP